MTMGRLLETKLKASYTVEASMVMIIYLGVILTITSTAFLLYKDVVKTATEEIKEAPYGVREVLMMKRLGGDVYESVCKECGIHSENEEQLCD